MSSTVGKKVNPFNGQSRDESIETKSDEKENTDYLSLKFSPILFINEEGLGLHFSMKPCLERRTIRQLIERGGGYMSSTNFSKDLINLVKLNANISDKQNSNHKFHYLTFVYDSCKTNTLMDFNKYLLWKTTTIEKTSDYEEPKNFNEDNQLLPEDVSEKDHSLKENSQQMSQNDLKILEFIGQRKAFADIVGSRIWTKALAEGIQFGSTCESMKQRFFSHIMPNIDNYPIDEINKNKFIEYYNRYKDSQCAVIANSPQNREENYEISTEEQELEKQIDDNNKEVVTDSLRSNESESEIKSNEIQSNHEKNETKCEQTLKESSESDLNFDEESEESTSKYFKTSEKFLYRRKNLPKSEENKTYFNAYLDFMKQRETSNTPENLMRIKKALKTIKNQKNEIKDQKNESKEKKNELKSQRNVYSLRERKDSKTSQSFGEKIVSKTRDEISKNETESQENGYKVSDISSDESEGKEKNQKNPNKSRVIHRTTLNPMPKRRISQKFNCPYTLSEEESILEFVTKSKRFGELKGNSLWEEAEKKDICEGRSWQSMKERFRKHIMPNIDSYDITKKEKQRLKLCYYSEDSNNNRSQTGSYTSDEDMAIIKYVIHKNGFDLVKGNKFWQTMDKELRKSKVCSRSWQSLKERYLKRILPNLYKYEIKLEFAKKILSSVSSLTESERQLILNKCKKNSIQSKVKKRELDIKQSQNDEKQDSDSNTEVDEQNQIQVLSRNTKRSKKS